MKGAAKLTLWAIPHLENREESAVQRGFPVSHIYLDKTVSAEINLKQVSLQTGELLTTKFHRDFHVMFWMIHAEDALCGFQGVILQCRIRYLNMSHSIYVTVVSTSCWPGEGTVKCLESPNNFRGQWKGYGAEKCHMARGTGQQTHMYS